MKKVGVELRGIRLAYGATEVLRGVSLAVEPGEFFALLGPSGSGKSTLLRLIAGFARHQHGEVLVDGVDLSRREPWQRDIGMVFQSYALWPHLTVWDNVAFGLVERRVARAELRRRVGEALELVGLGAFGERRPNQLSGGQQQRVALARTIVVEPQVLLLDEPLSNLDRTLRVQMRRELLALQRRLGITTIFVTHDQEEAMTTADRMAVLDHGVLQQVGTPTELYDEPANDFVASFVGTMNALVGTVISRHGDTITVAIDGAGELRLAGVAWPAEALGSPRVRLRFRPHFVRLAPAFGPGISDSDSDGLAGAVEASEFLGEFTRYRIAVAGQVITADLPHRAGQAPVAPGATVVVGIEPSQTTISAA